MIFGPIYCSFCGKDSNLLPLHLSLAEWQDMLPQRPNLEVDLSVLRPEKGKDENYLIILERNRKTKNRFLSTSTGLTSKWTIVVERKFFGTLRVLTLSQSFILFLSLSHSIWKIPHSLTFCFTFCLSLILSSHSVVHLKSISRNSISMLKFIWSSNRMMFRNDLK